MGIAENVEAKVENMRVIDHPHRFVLLEADVLSRGRDSSFHVLEFYRDEGADHVGRRSAGQAYFLGVRV